MGGSEKIVGKENALNVSCSFTTSQSDESIYLWIKAEVNGNIEEKMENILNKREANNNKIAKTNETYREGLNE